MELSFKQLSNHPLFKEDCFFMKLKDPPLEMFQGLRKEMLPIVGAIAKLDESFTEGHIKQDTIQAKMPYDSIVRFVANLLGKGDDLNALIEGRKLAKITRNFGEITSDSDFK